MRELPIFPLYTVLFPGVPLRLNIFEPRYQKMMKQVIESDQLFGVCPILHGDEAGGALAEPYRVGCTARVMEVEPLGDGRMTLLAAGAERFRVLRLSESPDGYWMGVVETFMLESPISLALVRASKSLQAELRRYVDGLRVLDPRGTAGLPEDEELAAFDLPGDVLPLLSVASMLLQVPVTEKIDLLAAPGGAQWMDEVRRLLRRETALVARLTGMDHASGLN